MKKKFMMAAVLLGALTLGSCVDDNESASVTAIREAKAAQLSALANYQQAQAEATKIIAEAEAAYKKAMADKEQQETAEAQARFEAELEAIKAEAEARLWEAKKNAAQYEQDLIDQADERLKELYATYANELSTLSDLKSEKAQADYDLIRYKNNLASVKEYITTQTAIKQASIDEKKLKIEAWKTYSGLDKNDIKLENEKLTQAKYDAFAKYQIAKETRESLQEPAEKVLDLYDASKIEISTVAAVAALQEFNANFPLGKYDFADWDEAENALSDSWDYIDGVSYDGETGKYYIEAIKIYLDGTNYYVSPITEEYVSLSEELSYPYSIEAPIYQLRNEATETFMSQYFERSKSSLEEVLGSPASDNKLATGFYLIKENAEKELEEAKKELTDAEEEFTKLEKAYKDASDAFDVAYADYKAKSTALSTAQTALTNAQEKLNEANLSGDQDKIDAAQKAYDAAEEALEKAQEAYDKANEVYIDANNELSEAQNDYNTSKYTTLPDAKNKLNEAELSLANVNDDIENYNELIENWDEYKTNWTTMVAALKNADYSKEVNELASNESVAAYITATIEEQKASDAYTEASTAASVTNNLLNNTNVKDPTSEIRTLENEIAQLETEIAALSETYNNGLNSKAEYERMIAEIEATIKGLESQIELQEAIVEMAKTRVEEAVADMTPNA